jgi:uncharacterized protein YjbJ (UPF0337 family)
MSSTGDKIKGATNDAVGHAKEAVGKAAGNEKLQGEGLAQEAKGKTQKAVGDAKDAVKDAAKKL